MNWRKSSRCESSSCVEMAYVKASASSDSYNCVEVASCDCDNTVHVRDSKDKSGPFLSFSGSAWNDFLEGVKSGKFDVA